MKTEIKTEEELVKAKREVKALRKAIFDVLNYVNLFFVILDKSMNVLLCNWSLATKLGFEDENGLIGKCWLDFLKNEEKDMLKNIYYSISNGEEGSEKYREMTTEILSLDGQPIVVKWFNIRINGETNATCSIGIQKDVPQEETIDSVRAYYRDIVDKDATMVEAFRDTIKAQM